jgi:hypothetical protein
MAIAPRSAMSAARGGSLRVAAPDVLFDADGEANRQ